jgi:hypothetical protein
VNTGYGVHCIARFKKPKYAVFFSKLYRHYSFSQVFLRKHLSTALYPERPFRMDYAMSASPHPSWQDVYQAAILEPDRLKVPGRVQCARKNLAQRWRELDPKLPDQRWELDRISNALRMLALLDKTSTAEGCASEAA